MTGFPVLIFINVCCSLSLFSWWIYVLPPRSQTSLCESTFLDKLISLKLVQYGHMCLSTVLTNQTTADTHLL